MRPVLLDTGVIVATLDKSERFHRVCVETISEIRAPLVTCESVIAESCYLSRNLKGAAEDILANVEEGIFQMPVGLAQTASQVRAILRKYRDTKIDLADACLIYLAAELDAPEILTLDRDFEYYRWGRNHPFQMLIPLGGE